MFFGIIEATVSMSTVYCQSSLLAIVLNSARKQKFCHCSHYF